MKPLHATLDRREARPSADCYSRSSRAPLESSARCLKETATPMTQYQGDEVDTAVYSDTFGEYVVSRSAVADLPDGIVGTLALVPALDIRAGAVIAGCPATS